MWRSIRNFRSSRVLSSTGSTCHSRPDSGQYDQHVARTRMTYTMTPRAYVSGLVQYSTGSQAVSGNFRFRWEWAPGSELFVVYTEERNTGALGERWSELSTRALVIKMTRLFRP